VQACLEYIAYMNKRQDIQYTLRSIPPRIDRVLRESSVKEQKSLNELAIAALAKGLGIAEEEVRYHDLDDLAGTWVEDPKFDKALKDMDKIDPELWK